MTTIYIVRHAEAEGNLYRRIHGIYNSRVTPTGLKQLELLRHRFEGVHLDAVYSSDLHRALLTAGAVAYSSGLEIRPTERLREVNMGCWEDKTWGEVLLRQRDQYINFSTYPHRWHVEGSEPFTDLQDRLERAVIDIAGKHKGGSIALATHGCAIRSLMCRITNTDPENIRTIPYCDNTGITTLSVEGDSITLIRHNDSDHLPDEYSRFRRQKWTKNKFGIDDSVFWFEGEDDSFKVMYMTDPAGDVRLDTRSGDTAYITDYILYPQYRGRKMSVQLLGQAVSTCRRLGYEKIAVELNGEQVELERYFEHYGFSVVDRETDGMVLEMDITLNQ